MNSHFAQRSVAAAVALCFGGYAIAQPAGLTPIHGTATLQQQGAQTTITTTNGAGTRHSAVDWRSFSVPARTGVYFSQPDTGSTSINRVLGGDPSSIFGTLGSNGKLVLVNPAGIAVGAGAVVDTAGFTASTLPMSRADAIAGRLNFGSGDTAGAGAAVSVQGEVLARNGDVVLIGPKVETGARAIVRADNGDVILGAGRKVYLTGRGLEGIRFEVRAPSDRAINLGRLQGDSVAIFASTLQHSGAIHARGSSDAGGKVVLQAAAQAEVAGSIQASRPEQGGSVHLTAENLVLKSAANIDVSHARGGGEILVGGGWQGGDARIVNARSVDVEAGVVLKADATLAGNGGTVVVWSDDVTRFRGAISARGGGAGDGGRAEVSGKRELVFRGNADLGAESGATGNLLLDPEVVTIRGGDLVGGVVGGEEPGGNFTLYQSQLEALNANVTIVADRLIQASGTFTGGELKIVRDRDLKMQLQDRQRGGILLRGMPIRTQGSGRVELRTTGKDQDIEVNRITTAGGTITLAAEDADVRLRGALQSGGSAISLAGKKVEFRAPQLFTGRVTVAASSISNEDLITLQSGATLATGGTDFDNRKDAVLEGSGLLDLGKGKLVNEGTLRPGGDGTIGDLRITGELDQKKDGRLEIDVAGPTRYDRLLVSGRAKLDGDLDIGAVGGYVPTSKDSYALLESSDVSARFDKFDKGRKDDRDKDDNKGKGKNEDDAPGFPGFRPVYQNTRVLFVGGLGSATPPAVTPGNPGAPTTPGASPAPSAPATPSSSTPETPTTSTPNTPATPAPATDATSAAPSTTPAATTPASATPTATTPTTTTPAATTSAATTSTAATPTAATPAATTSTATTPTASTPPSAAPTTSTPAAPVTAQPTQPQQPSQAPEVTVVEPTRPDTSSAGNNAAPVTPVAQQPAAVQETTASTEAFFARMATLASASSDSPEAAAAKRRIRVTAIQCRPD